MLQMSKIISGEYFDAIKFNSNPIITKRIDNRNIIFDEDNETMTITIDNIINYKKFECITEKYANDHSLQFKQIVMPNKSITLNPWEYMAPKEMKKMTIYLKTLKKNHVPTLNSKNFDLSVVKITSFGKFVQLAQKCSIKIALIPKILINKQTNEYHLKLQCHQYKFIHQNVLMAKSRERDRRILALLIDFGTSDDDSNDTVSVEI